MMVWTAALMLLAAMVLPLTGYVYVALVEGVQAQEAADENEINPRSEYWRAVRQGDTGITTASGPYTTNTMIQGGGETWRELRNGPISTFGPWLLGLMLLVIALYHLIKRPHGIRGGRSGETVTRWSVAERTMHWYTATLFIIMTVTGLSLLFGRRVLIPLMGPEGFAAWAQWAKDIHNYLGPFFSIGVLLIIISWIRYNVPSKTDWQWFKRGGGIIGSKEVSAGRMNGGEKAWFWIICSFGMATIVTGLIWDFPNLAYSRETMQWANVIHGVASLVWVTVFFGHAYIGTLGTEGALEGMTRGEVDVNWAKQHHDLWYEEIKGRSAAAGEGAEITPTDSVLRRHYEAARQRPV
jgi:formate dehydrogenase subunit gamma